MANRRMFSKQIIDSDDFLDMALSTQALYFHLGMRADDEGFVNNPKKIMRMIGSNQDEMKILIAKKFIIAFESGILVIKHWKIHNYIQSDRIKKTTYQDEKAKLSLKDNGSYTLDTKRIQNGYKTDTQDSIDKDSIDKDSIDKGSKNTKKEIPPLKLVQEYFFSTIQTKAENLNIITDELKVKAEWITFKEYYYGLDGFRGAWDNKKTKINYKSTVSRWINRVIVRLKSYDQKPDQIECNSWIDVELALENNCPEGTDINRLMKYLRNLDLNGRCDGWGYIGIARHGIKQSKREKR